jgi:hypothetical protein
MVSLAILRINRAGVMYAHHRVLTVYETLAVIAVGKLDIEGCFVLLWDLGGQVRDDIMNGAGGSSLRASGVFFS